jgi:hypothetical protein
VKTGGQLAPFIRSVATPLLPFIEKPVRSYLEERVLPTAARTGKRLFETGKRALSDIGSRLVGRLPQEAQAPARELGRTLGKKAEQVGEEKARELGEFVQSKAKPYISSSGLGNKSKKVKYFTGTGGAKKTKKRKMTTTGNRELNALKRQMLKK